MRKILLATAAAALFAGSAMAADLSGAYGNTVTVTNAAGETTKLFIDENNTYSATTAAGATHKGTWAVTGDQICFTQTEPAPAADAQASCGLVQTGKKAGDTWEQGEGDAKVTVAIVAGR